MCVLILITPCIGNISYSKKKSERYDKTVYCFSCKVHFTLVRFECNLNFLDMFSKNFQISNFMKILPVAAEFHADRRIDEQTDMTKLIVAFRSFANAPNKIYSFKANHTVQPVA
jgi:hypothetical protein